ncbi:glycosyltransferase family 2 protein [Vibrio atypicus]|jgi:glycosyltransferase involved in cell wall biosynthesis|uniref:glycosyltransferase family 2 protein n=1 Tax=Vibrio atypicus TaxID=558271 RepID=UPI0013593642|nr:glycosyltransferase family 2 protein [Vibrio atypicus]
MTELSSAVTCPHCGPSTESESDILLSVLVPYFNEEEVLPAFHDRLMPILEGIDGHCEVIYIDDGSSDKSQSIVADFESEHSTIVSLNLSRNFGKEAAMSAGLEYSRGQVVTILDADLQDPPELLPEMLDKWREGFDVVNMQRKERHGETWMKQKSAAWFYRLMNSVSQMDVPENVGDFRLLSRRVVEHINQLPERNRYMKGLFSWPGFNTTTLQFERDPRLVGETKWNYLKLVGLAIDGISSFSIRPLRLATLLGALMAVVAFLYGFIIICKTVFLGEPVVGYPSMMVVQLGLGGIQLLCIGLMGEYIGRIFIETKRRPLFIVQSNIEKQAKKASLQNNQTEDK